MTKSQTLFGYLQTLSGFDWLLLGIMLLSMIISVVRGALKELIGIATWVLAGFSAVHFNRWFADFLTPYLHSPSLRSVVAVVSLVIGVLLLGAFFSMIIGRLVQCTSMSGFDRLLGAVFGTLRGVALVALVLMGGQLLHYNETQWWQHAKLTVYYQPVLVWAKHDGKKMATDFYHRYIVQNTQSSHDPNALSDYVAKELSVMHFSQPKAKTTDAASTQPTDE